MRARHGGERGAALLVVMVAVAVLTALAVDLAYESRVSLQIAANARDELRASYLARSGVTLSRLVLSFQQTLDDATAGVPNVPGASVPRIQLWRMVPVGSSLAGSLFGGAATGGTAAAPSVRFDAVIEDEGRKVNAQLEALDSTNKLLSAQVQALYQLICEPRWDPLFDEDAQGQRTTREDLLIHFRDWVDGDPRSSALRASSAAATSCGMVVMQPAFEDGFGDENAPYDRGDDRYRAKNARMDSLDELYLVAGVTDAFMAAFGDAMTVYLPRDAKQNVNTIDREELLRLARIIASPRTQAPLFDPAFANRLQKAVILATFGGIGSLTPAAFGALVEGAGVVVDKNLIADATTPFTDRSITFRVRATGVAGDVTSAIDAVVRLEKAQAGAATAAPGRIIHWREE